MEIVPLDKNSSMPLYRQMIEAIKSDIANNVLKPNDQIPTEIELSEKYDVSRITVRKAVTELVEEGYLIKQQGVGTFVAEAKLERNMRKFMGFSMSCEIRGKKPSSDLVFAGLVDATERDKRELGLSEHITKVLSIKRVRYCDDNPVMIEDSHFSIDYSFLLTEDLTRSLYEILNKYNIFLTDGRTELDVCFATEEEANLLSISCDTPLLLVKSLCYDKAGVTVHNCRQIVNPKKFKMII